MCDRSAVRLALIPLLWLVLPTLAGLAVGIILAIPSPRYAPDYRPSAAASLAYLVSATFMGLLVGLVLSDDAHREHATRKAAECFMFARAARLPEDEAEWCVTHMAGTITDRLSTGPSRPLDARAQAFAECFARVYDYRDPGAPFDCFRRHY